MEPDETGAAGGTEGTGPQDADSAAPEPNAPGGAPPPFGGTAGGPVPPSPYAPGPPPAPAPYPGSPYAPGAGGFGFPGQPPLPPQPPAVPQGPADPLRALAAGLLNLSGLGLGYALMRRWAAMLVCWAATAVLLINALPADPDGVPHRLVTGYLAVLGLAAVHGAIRGRHTPFSWPPKAPLALVLGLVLLAVPVGGLASYDSARDEATQKMLLDRLATADTLVQAAKAKPFDAAQADYRTALSTYRDLHRNHTGSRAAKRVPGRLSTFYSTVGAPYDRREFCDAIAPLTFLRTVPGSYGAKDLGSLAGWPDDRLATSLYECGAADLAHGGTGAAGGQDDFAELLTTFPHSPQAAKVEPAVSAGITSAAKGVNGSDPCAAGDRLKALGTRAADLPGDAAGLTSALAGDSRRAGGYAESATYACGVHQYKTADFDSALDTMNDFVKTYPHDRNHALAQKFAIAAEIAKEDPAAGKHVPTLGSGGGIDVTVSNDSPDPIVVLYTGKVTGTFTLPACKGCTTYSSETTARSVACNGGKHYPKRTLSLPPGAVYFMHKASNDSSGNPATDSETLRYGYIYTECAYSVNSQFGL
jgi:outer membrane protein assembly factor BamD (BamD/ComL family)